MSDMLGMIGWKWNGWARRRLPTKANLETRVIGSKLRVETKPSPSARQHISRERSDGQLKPLSPSQPL